MPDRKVSPAAFALFTLLLFYLLHPGELTAVEIRSNQGKKAPVLIGFAQDTLANDWRNAQVQAVQKKLAAYPHIRFIYTDGKGSTAKQIQDIEDLILQGIDILITSPRDSQAMMPAISRAYRKGIPVILITRKIEGDDYTTFIAPDDEAISREAAGYIAKELGNKGDVLMLQGLPSASTAITRSNAFVKELKKFPGIRIAAIKTANYLRSDAIRAIEEAIRQDIHFDAIFAQSDSMAAGARIALKKSGRDLSDVLIVGIDYIQEAREAIRAGTQSASFTYPICADEAVDAVLDIIAGKTIPKNIRVKSQRVTRDNVEQVNPIF